MLYDIAVALWFFAPAGAANVAPVFAAKIPFIRRFTTPLDGGLHFRGNRVFGANKTWRGLIVGILAAIGTVALQQTIVASNPGMERYFADLNYAELPTILLGTLFAIGALGGDAIESFFKRLRGIKPGEAWVPFDQTDYIIGAIITTAPIVALTLPQYAWILAFWCGIHFISSYIGWKMHLKKQPV